MTKTAMTISPLLGLAPCVVMAGCSGVRPTNLGVKDGKLAPCPAWPNCVSSQSSDKEHAVAPLTYTSPLPEAVATMKKLVLGMKRTRITDEGTAYLRAEFTSALFRFVDDVEFYFDDGAKVIQVRSASRLGHSDLGVNRKRMEDIRTAWQAPGK